MQNRQTTWGVSTAVLAALCGALIACSEANNDVGIDDLRPSWETLSDGSSFARIFDVERGAALAMRCWPADGGTFDCLQAGELDLSGATMIARTEETELPAILLPLVSADNGYSCTHAFDPHETISRNGEQLVSNIARSGRGAWSRSYVREYMADNEIKGPGWFPCLEVLDLVRSGSLATLATTSVKRSMLGE